MLENTLIFWNDGWKNQRKWTKSREFLCYTHWEVGNFEPKFWQILRLIYFQTIDCNSITFLKIVA